MTDVETCKRSWWKIAAGIGLVLGLLLWLLGGWSFWQALFAAIVVAIILGAVLGNIKCKPAEVPVTRPKPVERAPAPAPAAAAPAPAAAPEPAAPAPEAAPEPVVVAAPASAAKAFVMKPSKPLAGQKELSERRGSWKYQRPEAVPAAAAAMPVAAAAPVADAPVSDAHKPELLTSARGAGADDLKLISGVGPKLEGMLNTLGVWHYDQIASWDAAQVAWVNDNLQGFKGRIARDNWVEQAGILAAGGETEFSRRKKT